jgi:ribose-phosphate pyrophosphokinase
MKPLLVPLQDTAQISGPLASALDAETADIDLRRFPDGETYLRFDTLPEGRDVILLAGLSHPDAKLPALVFAAQTARALGAASVGLVAPYLPYMRQDRVFRPGEAVTSVQFAKLVSSCVDWLVTIDPHLHRWHALSDIYDIPARAAHAAPAMAAWISREVDHPLLIGPDAESEQWVSEIAALAGAEHIVLTKTRHGDRDVDISPPDLGKWRHHTPVIVDDTISTASTMMAVTRQLVEQGLRPPTCCAAHGVFADGAFEALLQAGAARIVTSNTISHPSNGIDVSGILACAANGLIEEIRPSSR